ncbi:hypothetical protein DMN91_003298, partial [Ooceraea biroi]
GRRARGRGRNVTRGVNSERRKIDGWGEVCLRRRSRASLDASICRKNEDRTSGLRRSRNFAKGAGRITVSRPTLTCVCDCRARDPPGRCAPREAPRRERSAVSLATRCPRTRASIGDSAIAPNASAIRTFSSTLARRIGSGSAIRTRRDDDVLDTPVLELA